MNDISMLARRWLRQAELGRGIRLSAEETDLLNAIGIGELLTAEAAKTMRAQCRLRTLNSTPGENTGLNGTEAEMELSERRTSKSYGMTNLPDVTAIAARALRRSGAPRTS